MVNYCSVFGCKNNATMENVRFHRFPRDVKLAKQWEVALKMGKPHTKTMVVCSYHFDEKDYLPKPQFEHSNLLTYPPRLRPLAVPLVNLPVRKFERKKVDNSRLERLKKRREALKKKTETLKSTLHAGLTETIELNQASEAPRLINIFESTENPTTSKENTVESSPNKQGTSKLNDKCIMVNTLNHHTCYVNAVNGMLNPSTIIPLTGLQCMGLFNKIVEHVEREFPSRIVMNVRDRVFLTLMKLKLGITFSALAALFGISRVQASNDFKLTITQLVTILECAVKWLSKEETMQCMPQCFSEFKNTRVVLDCTEVEVEKPACLQCKIKTYSHYKGRNTTKILVVIAPSGVITYVSKAYCGRCSDQQVTEESKILDKCEGFIDGIMVDKGFAIENLCNERNLELIRPPFLKKKKQFSREEALRNSKIAAARVHVERTIGRMRAYNCLNNKLPFDLLPYASSMITVISAIINLSTPILADNKF